MCDHTLLPLDVLPLTTMMIHIDHELHWIRKPLWNCQDSPLGVWWHFPRQVKQEGSDQTNRLIL